MGEKKVPLMNQESMNMHIYSALLKAIKEKHVKAIKISLDLSLDLSSYKGHKGNKNYRPCINSFIIF